MSMRERLLASSMICGAALLSLAASPALAQAAADDEVAEIVVTGSRIPQPNLTSVSPVAVVGAEEVKLQGTTRIEDLVNSLPQAFGNFGGNLSNGATGAATVNLRNMGNQRTLVLIDGRRLLPGDPTQNGNSVPDLNAIPSSLVDRVEVLTGGASAVYGADAVAGVVNFIMMKNFEGLRIDAQTSFYQHNNDNSNVQGILAAKAATNPTEFRLPDENVTDGTSNEITIVMGVNAPDGKGNVTAYAAYRNIKPVFQSTRDYSACALGSSTPANPNFTCGGSGTNALGQFQLYSDPGLSTLLSTLTLNPAGAGNAFRPYVAARDQYNFAPSNYYQRPDERYSLGAFGRYEINSHLEVYSQLMFMDDRSVAQIAPSGVFGQQVSISCTNPLLSASQVQDLCVTGRPAPVANADIVLFRRNVEGGGRQADFRHTSYRALFGARGEISEGWNYDLYGQYGTAIYAQNYLNEFSLARTARALDSVVNPATGQVVCRTFLSGEDTACVPYNPFSVGGVTPAQLAYVQVPGFMQGSTTEHVVSGQVSGDLGQYGLKSPMATDGIGIAFGAEYRREASELRVDTGFATGDLAGQGGATLNTAGAYDVYELFGEARLPLVQDAPWAKSLSLETAYRFSDYNLGFTTNTYKFGGDWAPMDDIRFRASYQRAVRAPNIQELFRPASVQLDGTTDPCAGANPAAADANATAANCARTGVLAGQYGNIIANSAAQYNGFTGGNPALEPETADSYTVGFVATPRFLPGFSLSVDWFNIKVKDVINTIGADTILDRCLKTGDAFFCSKIHRAPGTGSLWIGTNGFVDDTNFNLGSLETTGVDLEANYRMNLADVGVGEYGGLSFNFVGTWTDELLTETLKGDEPYDCAGFYGPVCLTPTPEWRHKLRTTWTTPWQVSLSGSWRYMSEVKLGTSLAEATAPLTDVRLKKQNYFDLAATWDVRNNVTLRAGVNNVFDKEPPLVGQANCPATFCSGNTFPQVYDALGRYFFFSLTADF
jgi:outer membrane receptor protein involved in Fe transport